MYNWWGSGHRVGRGAASQGEERSGGAAGSGESYRGTRPGADDPSEITGG